MFEKHVRIYAITDDLKLDPARLDAALAEHKSAPLLAHEALKIGFTFPLPSVKSFVHAGQDDLLLISLKRTEKLLPAAVVQEELQPKIDALEAEKCRPLGRKEKQALKEELLMELLPRAFSKSTVTRAVIDLKQKLVFVFTTSAARAEDLLAMLRKSIGSLPVVPWIDANNLSMTMQEWIKEKSLPAEMVLGHTVEFKAPDEEGAMAKFTNQLLNVSEVQSCVEDKLVRKVELQIKERLSFVICDDTTIKNMDWGDVVMGANEELGWDDLLLRTDADLLVMITELRKVVSSLNHSIRHAEDKAA